MLVKHFRLNGKLNETRLFTRHGNGDWGGYSYEWNLAETDAVLLPQDKVKLIGSDKWIYPSRAQCLRCHTEAAGAALGLETAQMNRDFTYPGTGITANQLDTLEHIGLFDAPIVDPPALLPAFVDPFDPGEDLHERARTYLHVNCSSCHRPGGGGAGPMDVRFGTPDSQMQVCNVSPVGEVLGGAGAVLIKPGDPSLSIIRYRMSSTSSATRMPVRGQEQARPRRGRSHGRLDQRDAGLSLTARRVFEQLRWPVTELARIKCGPVFPTDAVASRRKSWPGKEAAAR